ncbi:MAG: hypothetical protein QM655_03875 [Nocardioidaceae bacterium]
MDTNTSDISTSATGTLDPSAETVVYAAAPERTPKVPFGERVTKLWHTLAVGAASLIIGLGGGFAIGHATAGGGQQGPGGQMQPPNGAPGQSNGQMNGQSTDGTGQGTSDQSGTDG